MLQYVCTNACFESMLTSDRLQRIQQLSARYVSLLAYIWWRKFNLTSCMGFHVPNLTSLMDWVLKVPWHANFLIHILKAGVSMIISIPNISQKNVYFMSYINLKVRKGSSKYNFDNGDSLKLEGNYPLWHRQF